MIEVIVERSCEPAIRASEHQSLIEESMAYHNRYPLTWRESYLSSDGRRLVDHFQARNEEVVELVSRPSVIPHRELWCATHISEGLDLIPNVLVERRFDKPMELATIQAIEDAGAPCLQMRNVTFTHTLVALDNMRMLCLYHAPDAQSVRDAEAEAGMPVERVWACQRLTAPA